MYVGAVYAVDAPENIIQSEMKINSCRDDIRWIVTTGGFALDDEKKGEMVVLRRYGCSWTATVRGAFSLMKWWNELYSIWNNIFY